MAKKRPTTQSGSVGRGGASSAGKGVAVKTSGGAGVGKKAAKPKAVKAVTKPKLAAVKAGKQLKAGVGKLKNSTTKVKAAKAGKGELAGSFGKAVAVKPVGKASKTDGVKAKSAQMAAKAPAAPVRYEPAKRPAEGYWPASRPGVNVVMPAPVAAPVLPPDPMTTDSKARKNQAGLTIKELDFFRDLLLAKRRELVGDMRSMESEALLSSGSSGLSNLPVHMADMGTDNYEQEFTLGLVEKERNLVREINLALAKIQAGTYGICEGTQLPISKPRLEAQPWARYSIEYARQLERRTRRY